MKKKLNAEWALNLNAMKPKWADKEDVARVKIAQLADYIKSESDGAFLLDKSSGHIVQKKELPWSYIFDIIRNAPEFGYVILMKIPPRFKIKNSEPMRGAMYAYYNSENDAIRIRVYTGERREDLAGYDGFGRGPDELEAIEGHRDRDGNWIEELNLKWI